MEATQLARDANRLTADLTRPRAAVYWADLLVTAAVAWASLAAAALAPAAIAWPAGALAVLALYRAIGFIHELTHLRQWDAPGFRFGWNLAVGVPFLIPSFLYEGVHNLHHIRPLYGTDQDPEYLPLARSGPGAIAGFLGVAALAPLGAFLRFAVLAPLGWLAPRFGAVVFARFSALSINPAFRRQDAAFGRSLAWRAQEVGCWLWSWGLVAIAASGPAGLRAVLVAAAVMSAAAVINQARTLVAHAWTSDGRPMSLAEQFLDSVNVPPPAVLPLIWAPVGLRYHALHHLLPSVPYHNLREAHRRLARALPPDSDYHRVQHPGPIAPLRTLLARSATRGRDPSDAAQDGAAPHGSPPAPEGRCAGQRQNAA